MIIVHIFHVRTRGAAKRSHPVRRIKAPASLGARVAPNWKFERIHLSEEWWNGFKIVKNCKVPLNKKKSSCVSLLLRTGELRRQQCTWLPWVWTEKHSICPPSRTFETLTPVSGPDKPANGQPVPSAPSPGRPAGPLLIEGLIYLAHATHYPS